MASWVCYTRKVLSSALTSIAGELEQTAQDFNDAFHHLSKAPTGEQEKDVMSEATPETAPILPEPAGETNPLSRLSECKQNITFKSTNISTPTSMNVKHFPTGSIRSQLKPHSKQLCSSHSDMKTMSEPTATTHQPQPSGSVCSHADDVSNLIHSRLSQSSPSLCPLSSYNDLSGNSSDTEEDRSSPKPITDGSYQCAAATRPQAIRLDNRAKPMTYSVSTPCLIHVHKMLPSCKKNFNCASTSSMKTTTTTTTSLKSSNTSFTSETSAIFSHSLHSVVTHASDNKRLSNNNKHGQRQGVSKRPGRVVVVSQPPPISIQNSVPKDGAEKQQSRVLNADNTKKLIQLEQSTHTKSDDSFRETTNNTQTPLGNSGEQGQKTVKAVSDTEARSDSPQDQIVIRTVKTNLHIEREVTTPRWPVLAPLTRVLNFAYSQVVNALLLLQEEEHSVSSGNPRSSVSSISRGAISGTLSPNQIVSSSPLHISNVTAEQINSDMKNNLTDKMSSYHRRQLSQLSLAGSTFSSDSFEVLDMTGDMETSNFIYIGDDASSGDILREYHLFPSKSLHTPSQDVKTSNMVDGLASSSTATSKNRPSGSPVGDEDIMSSSSADFAHFNFSELISNMQENKLNPVPGLSDVAGTSDDAEDFLITEVDGECKDNIEMSDSMFESFVILDNRESIPQTEDESLRV